MAKRVIVIGSGIIGASAAYHLARAGAEVTVLEAGEPGGVATRASWAWINASWGNPEPYFRLRMRSMAEWRRLQGEVPDVGLDWCGGVIWDLPEPELAAYAEERAAWDMNISGVPAMILEGRFIVPGAQPPEAYANALRRVAEKTAAA